MQEGVFLVVVFPQKGAVASLKRPRWGRPGRSSAFSRAKVPDELSLESLENMPCQPSASFLFLCSWKAIVTYTWGRLRWCEEFV